MRFALYLLGRELIEFHFERIRPPQPPPPPPKKPPYGFSPPEHTEEDE